MVVKDLGIADAEVAEHIDLPTAELIRLDDGVVWICYKDVEDEITVEQAQATSEALERITGGAPVHLIIDFRGTNVAFSNEAREYFAKSAKHSKVRKSQALIIEGLGHKIVANFYMNFNRPNCPVSLFTDPKEALAWTRELQNNA